MGEGGRKKHMVGGKWGGEKYIWGEAKYACEGRGGRDIGMQFNSFCALIKDREIHN